MAALGRFREVLRPLALLAAPLSIALLIDRHGVDVPVWDQWNGVVPLFEKSEAGSLGPADFYAQHNEHRILFPRLIMFGLAHATGWNIRAELFVSWLLACVCSFHFWRLACATGWGDSTLGGWLFVVLNILLFTPVQYANWLLGMQIAVWLPVVCTTACAWIALLPRVPVRYTATAMLAVISTFSVASGFLCWVLTLPLLLFRTDTSARRDERLWLALWLASFALSLSLYFRRFEAPGQILAFATRPLDAIQFVCAFLGANFAFGTALPPLALATFAGALLLLLTFGCLCHLWRWRRDRQLLARALPWLVPPGFAVGNAVLTTIGRVGFGVDVDTALPPRYVTFSILLPIGLVFLVPLLVRHWREQSPSRRRNALVASLTATAVAFAMLHLLGSLVSISEWVDVQRTQRIAKALVELIDVSDEPEDLARYVHADVPPLRSRALLLDRLGFLRPGLVRSRSIAAIADPQDPGSADYGAIERSGVTESGVWGAVGWAVLPYARRPADAVVLTYEVGGGEPVIFGLAGIGKRRDDLVGTLREAAYLRSGWSEKLDGDRVAEGAVAVKAWAFDAERGRAYRLAGVATRPGR